MRVSNHFKPIHIEGRNLQPEQAGARGCSSAVRERVNELPLGERAYWGIPPSLGVNTMKV